MVSDRVAVLLEGVGSRSPAVAEPVTATVPACEGVAPMNTVAVPPTGRVPSATVTVPLTKLAVPREVVADWYAKLDGNACVNVALGAAFVIVNA